MLSPGQPSPIITTSSHSILYVPKLSSIQYCSTDHLFYQVWIFVELTFVYFFYVETRGPTLEELAKIFDGENAEVAHLDMNTVEKEVHDGSDPLDEKTAIHTNTSTV